MNELFSITDYLESIKGVELPERGSRIIYDFANFVVDEDECQKAPFAIDDKMVRFNFYVGSSRLPGLCNSFEKAKFNDLDVRFPARGQMSGAMLPREIYDAGYVALPEDRYASDASRKIMVATIDNMLDAVSYYRNVHGFK